MNNHQNAIFHQITNFLKTPLALLGVDLKNFQFNKICHFANHPYLCKGLSLIKVNLSVLFKVTLAYLILQAGFLLGYSLHEGFSALKGYGMIDPNHFVFNKAYNLAGTILSHKDGIFGIPLHVLFGWYSKPEWVQFMMQYVFTVGMFTYWRSYNANK